MIGRLTGTVVECGPGQLVLDVGGVGYDVRIPLSTYYEVVAGKRDAPVTLHVHTHVREEALQLFGFSTRDERSLFELLISISGVGPRIALAILSGIGVRELHVAVAAQDRGRLQKIPGVGKKTAERLMLELRDKLDGRSTAAASVDTPVTAPDGALGVREDAISALTNLGYPADQAERAVGPALEAVGADAALEHVLKAALGRLVR